MFDFQQGGMILKKYLPILKNSPFFTGLTDNEILSILHCVKATAVSQKRDSYIFRAGDSTEVMGLVGELRAATIAARPRLLVVVLRQNNLT